MLDRYKNIIDNELEKYCKELPKLTIYKPIKYILQLGGKRFRPSLTLLATDLFCGDPLRSIKESIAIELFHNFTLIHDDIMDQAPLRRNHPSVHQKWDVNQAILSGDLLYSLVNKLLASSPCQTIEIHQLFQETAIEVCEGQSIDIEFEKKEDISLNEYIKMIQLKTSVLVACSLKIGAIIGGARLKDANLLYDFGLNLGTAFQIHDDILDIYPEKEGFGKQIGGDIIEKKKTILLIELLKNSSQEDHKSIQNILEDSRLENNFKVAKIKSYYKKYRVLDIAEKTKKIYFDKAISSIAKINISNEKKLLLKEFAMTLMSREF